LLTVEFSAEGLLEEAKVHTALTRDLTHTARNPAEEPKAEA
jgi:hypothetical protein